MPSGPPPQVHCTREPPHLELTCPSTTWRSARADAEEDYQLAELYYTRTNEEHFASVRMARALRAYEHRYRLRLAKIPVDAVAERLEIAAVTVNPLGDSPEAKEDPLTQTLQDEVRDLNDMDVAEGEIMLHACEYGDAFVIVDQDDEGTSPSTTTTRSSAGSSTTAPGAISASRSRSGPSSTPGRRFLRATLFYNDAIEEYATKAGHDGSNIQDWAAFGLGTPYLDEDGREVAEDGVHYDFGQIPVFHLRTGRPMARPSTRPPTARRT